MKFGPMFNKLFKAYPEIDKSVIVNNKLHLLTRRELYAIIKGIKAHGDPIPFELAQPTRTKSLVLRYFIYGKMS